MPLDGKVMRSTKVSPMAREMQNNPLNPDLGRNPSQAGMNNKTVPSHSDWGMSSPGTNGPSVSRYPLGQRDR
jgi:hypothetical protein